MKIKFCGADRTVTGSQHLLEVNGKKILLDCGMFQGKREEAYDINKSFLFDPAEVDCVILSHAHIDHSGNLPSLIRKGFTGDIYSTTATRDLCAIMLLDSAHIQERDVEFVNKKRAKKGEYLFETLYDFDDVRNTMKLFKASSYNKSYYLDDFDNKISVTFYDAGHILGSAQVVLDIQENEKKFKLGFTGDLGRPNLPILKDPEFMGNVDYLLSESTYGGRLHDSAIDIDSQLEKALKDAIARGGKVIIPAFSVGRTQEIVYSLSKMFDKNVLPKIPIFIDSPLSTNVSDVFKIHHECFDKETSELITRGVDVFGFSNLTYIKDVEESKKLNDFKGTCVIISASGMCEAGRVLHHLANNIEDEKSTILIVGYMAENTLGKRLVESKDDLNAVVRIYGDEYRVKAKIVVLNSFSAHADENELLNYFSQFDKSNIENIFLVHGDYDQQLIFQDALKNKGFKNISIPEKGNESEI